MVQAATIIEDNGASLLSNLVICEVCTRVYSVLQIAILNKIVMLIKK